MCRDNETLNYIRSVVRIIFNFSVALALIKNIYNLILSTLGVDNPYLYEDPYEEDVNFIHDINGVGLEKWTKISRKGQITRRRTL